jgi:hypothetical protein
LSFIKISPPPPPNVLDAGFPEFPDIPVGYENMLVSTPKAPVDKPGRLGNPGADAILKFINAESTVPVGFYLPQGAKRGAEATDNSTLFLLEQLLNSGVKPAELSVNVNSFFGFYSGSKERVERVNTIVTDHNSSASISVWLEGLSLQAINSPESKFREAVLESREVKSGRFAPGEVILDPVNPELLQYYCEKVAELTALPNVRTVKFDDHWGIFALGKWQKKHPGEDAMAAMTKGFAEIVNAVRLKDKETRKKTATLVSLSVNGRFGVGGPAWKNKVDVVKWIDNGLVNSLEVQAYRPATGSLKELLNEIERDIRAHPATFKKLKQFSLALSTSVNGKVLDDSIRLEQLKLASDFVQRMQREFGPKGSVAIFPGGYIDFITGQNTKHPLDRD